MNSIHQHTRHFLTGSLVTLAAALTNVAPFTIASAQTTVTAAHTPQKVGERVRGTALTGLPGLSRVATAGAMAPGAWLSLFAGYGFSGAIIDMDDSHHRGAGGFAASFRPVEWLGLALRLDGRYEKHLEVPNGTDDGWVGDPRLYGRVGKDIGSIKLGGQLGLWFPGQNAPSLVFDAISIDLVGLVSFAPSSAKWSIHGNGGFRVDRSAKSIDNAAALSDADRLGLQISDSNAVLLGVGASYQFGKLDVFGEWSWDRLVGSDAPKPRRSPMRVGAGARLGLSSHLDVSLVSEVAVSKRPPVTATAPLVPIDPTVTVMAGITYRLPYKRPKPAKAIIIEPPPVAKKTAIVSGEVVGSTGKPIANAQISVLAQTTRVVSTDEGGKFRVEIVLEPDMGESIGVDVEAEGYKGKRLSVPLSADKPVEKRITLERHVPPGLLQGLIRSFSGEPLAATIEIQPGDIRATAGADGTFEVELPEGEYEVIVRHKGYQEQKRTVRIQSRGVVLHNVDMRQ